MEIFIESCLDEGKAQDDRNSLVRCEDKSKLSEVKNQMLAQRKSNLRRRHRGVHISRGPIGTLCEK